MENDAENRPRPKRRTLNPQELHEGWLENLRNEERTMKKSLRVCLDEGITSFPDRVQQILQFQFPDSDEEAEPGLTQPGAWRKHQWIPKGKLGEIEKIKQTATKKEELMLIDRIAAARYDHQPLELLVERAGKRVLDEKLVRAMKSRISLKFPLAVLDKAKPRSKVSVKQSVIDDFNRTYAANCDQTLQRKRMRNVSFDSPFEPRNKPPAQHLAPDIIMEKPGKIDMLRQPRNTKPLAGRLSEIGK